MGRIIVFTGKGGVGKTSVAAAHARHSAKEGIKTLLASTDMAHNISDIFDMRLGKEAMEVEKNLFLLEIDPNHIMENDFQEMQGAFVNFIKSSSNPMPELEQITVFPGMDEFFSLLKIMEIYESGEYGRIIIDCAPTGETLSLLKFPELLSWYMEKFLPVGKAALKVLSPISKTVFKVELPNKAAVSEIEKLYVKMTELQELLRNREVTSIRLVAMPEKMVVEETKRNYMYLNLYDFQVDGLFINRILPGDMNNPFFKEWIGIQSRYIEELEAVFSHIPIYHIPWFDTDLNGAEGIDKIVEKVLRGREIFKVQNDIQSETYEKRENAYLLKVNLPCALKEELQIHETDSDIMIKIGNFKRNIPKPGTLRHYGITEAKLADGQLRLLLEKSMEAGRE